MRGFMCGVLFGLFSGAWYFGNLPEPMEARLTAMINGLGSTVQTWVDKFDADEIVVQACDPPPKGTPPLTTVIGVPGPHPQAPPVDPQTQGREDVLSPASPIKRAIATGDKYELTSRIISSSLYASAIKGSVPDRITMNLIRLYSHDIDFQRDIRPGDEFELLYEHTRDDTGQLLKSGNIEFASLTVRSRKTDYYRFTTPDDNRVDYFDKSGQSARKFLMRTPIDRARISSAFGKRKHPVLGYTRDHAGIDFAAPKGTAVLAAGDGVVDWSKPYGSYGNYIRIHHGKEYMTTYAHLSRFGRGLEPGRLVRQGQTIGYVGTTGLTAGAHLHYEVIYKGVKMNPVDVKVVSGRKLSGDILNTFHAEVNRIDLVRAELSDRRQIANLTYTGRPQGGPRRKPDHRTSLPHPG